MKIAILGYTGAGKSTLAKHFNSILLPCGGSVSVFGLNTSDPDKLIAIRRHIGMVFQNYAIFPHLTVTQSSCFFTKSTVF